MRNENIIIDTGIVIYLIVTFALSAVLPAAAYEVLLFITILGVCAYAIMRIYKKWNFPAAFLKPDKEQAALVARYYEKIEMEQKRMEIFQFNIFLPLLVFLIALNLIMWFLVQTVMYILIYLAVLMGILSVLYVVMKHFFGSSKFDENRDATDYLIAKVEVDHASYYKSFKYQRTYYYVRVRYNNATIKLTIPYHIYCDIVSQQCARGYLVKYPKGKGYYDRFDFIPESMYHVRPMKMENEGWL